MPPLMLRHSRMSTLRLLLDTADVSLWREWMPSGLFTGLTTNPLLLQRAGVSCDLETLGELAGVGFELGADEIHMQVWGSTIADMITIGRQLAAIDERVVVKVPITQDGCAAAHRLIGEGIPVTLTAVYAAFQVVVAASLGARYAAPYLGRMNEAGRDGFGDIVTMHQVTRQVDTDLELLVASLRSPDDIARLARAGLHVFTIAPTIAEALLTDPITEIASTEFDAAAASMGAVDPSGI